MEGLKCACPDKERAQGVWCRWRRRELNKTSHYADRSGVFIFVEVAEAPRTLSHEKFLMQRFYADF